MMIWSSHPYDKKGNEKRKQPEPFGGGLETVAEAVDKKGNNKPNDCFNEVLKGIVPLISASGHLENKQGHKHGFLVDLGAAGVRVRKVLRHIRG